MTKFYRVSPHLTTQLRPLCDEFLRVTCTVSEFASVSYLRAIKETRWPIIGQRILGAIMNARDLGRSPNDVGADTVRRLSPMTIADTSPLRLR